MAQYDDRTGDPTNGQPRGFSIGVPERSPRVQDEQVMISPSSRIPSAYLPEDLYVHLQDDDGRMLFDSDGRPVMVKHMMQKPRTAVRGIYAILTIIVLVILVNAVLAIVGLVELHNLSTGGY